MAQWKLINKNEPLDPGDRIRMFYTIIGPTIIMAGQIAAIEKKLDSDPRFTLISSSLSEGGWVRDIWFEILIKKPPQPIPQIQQASITSAVISAVIISAFAVIGIFCWLSLKEVRKMEIVPEAKEVIKETGWTAMKIGAAAIIGAIALNLWKK